MINHCTTPHGISAYLPKNSLAAAMICITVIAGISCDSNSKEDVEQSTTSAEVTWDNYDPPEPTEHMVKTLQVDPAIYPYQECITDPDVISSVSPESITIGEDGTEQLCVWHHPAGCVPDGLKYTDVMSCDEVRTLGPSWFIPPTRKVTTPPEVLSDPEYQSELQWVKEQVAASACSCCHSSAAGYASYFDIDAPDSWIDTISINGIVWGAGLTKEHVHFGYLPPSVNFGYDRETTLFATKDIPRMLDFFQKEFDRRGGTDEDVIGTREAFYAVNGSLFEEPEECTFGEGVDPEGNLIWKGDEVRQIYIQELGTESPSSPPFLDKPEGTVWALYTNFDGAPLFSGTIKPGEVPVGSRQAVPEDSTEPNFEVGRQYRLFIWPDFLRVPQTNCVFTYGETIEPPSERTCESDETLCATVVIPEDLSETPEKMLVALYSSLPPLGPPDVFPPYSVDEPSLTPSSSVDVMLEAAAEGSYQVYAVLYMPGGGLASWRPMPGVDYVAQSEPLVLDGNGMTLPTPLVFKIAE